MAFRVVARTLLHLGAELISSDAVAFYELIKNGFDARSPQVRINVYVRCPAARDFLEKLKELLVTRASEEQRNEELAKWIERISGAVDKTAPGADRLLARIAACGDFDSLRSALRSANYIRVIDTGHGMSLKELDEIYLTIGTRSRLVEKRAQRSRKKGDEHSILGEKGVGRLAAMRLGSRLTVTTSRKGEPRWNKLDIDWELFSHDSDEEIENIKIEPYSGEKKESADVEGTTIRIGALTAKWTKTKLEEIAKYEVAKFMDPFSVQPRQRLFLRFNDELVSIPKLSQLLFENAHAVVDVAFGPNKAEGGDIALTGSVDYTAGGKSSVFNISGEHLLSVAKSDLPTLARLGPFQAKFYWFNRQALEAVEGIGEKKQVKELVNQWSGGLMLFRDGFRVSPYGNQDDDWLDLDRKALASAGYKVNRKQIIGKVDITSSDNWALVDQTNREGLQECPEKEAMVLILKHIMEVQFRAFINQVDEQNSAQQPYDIGALRGRIIAQKKHVRGVLDVLVRRYPDVKKDEDLVPIIEESLEKIASTAQQLERVAAGHEAKQAEMLHLAGLGMLAEILAHELWRTTSHALTLIAEIEAGRAKQAGPAVMRALSAQLKTLQKRLQILDPVNTSARQVKTAFDLVSLVEDILKSRSAQFERHDIALRFEVVPPGAPKLLEVKMVRGMVVQVLENLVENSVYWLKRRREAKSDFKPELKVTVDGRHRELRVEDNGPGVSPERAEDIFRPFVTTKPPGEGKGLGLYIAREIAKYHDGELKLSDTRNPSSGNLNTFVLRFK